MSDLRLCALAGLLALTACNASPPVVGDEFEVSEGLEMTLWASEPLLVNPTNFDIDERGRVWFIESVNYRSDLKSKPWNDLEGDRIVILEDTDGDGRADSRKIFDQHGDMLAPLGISVLGDKVIVSQSPDLFVYTKDENDNIVSKETLLTGWGGIDHDHGLHAVLFGHDGRYYFNSGDQGFSVTDRSGNSTQSSREGPYYAATVQSVNPDGTDFRVLAHNARNPYEIALDSYGSIWQTDNDDDGNRWTRLLYVMEGANYGYWGPGGRRWREDRGSHFHEERPSTTPYVARTGPGSPTGLVVYEGDLLPPRYRGQLLHSEPGKRLIQAFFVSPDGAGYSMEAENLVKTTDPIFRPSDIAVAPDGSVFIADWQDPVVGGHNMLDLERGRIFRLAPIGHRLEVPRLDLESDQGVLAAFASPNQAVRYRAYQEIALRGADERRDLLLRAWRGESDVARARSLWMLAGLGETGAEALAEARQSEDPRLRVLALRVERAMGRDPLALAQACADDRDPRVRREAALALREIDSERKVAAWLTLADSYDGEDRWYLAALGIAATGAEDAAFRALWSKHPQLDHRVSQLYRVLQALSSASLLADIVQDRSAAVEQRMDALNALGWLPSERAARVVAGLAARTDTPAELRGRALFLLARQLFSEWRDLQNDPQVLAAVRRSLGEAETRAIALELAELLRRPQFAVELAALAGDVAALEGERASALRILGAVGGDVAVRLLEAQAGEGPVALRVAAVQGLGAAGPDDILERLRELMLSDAPNDVRSAALQAMGRRPGGQRMILTMEESLELPAEMRALASSIVNASRDPEVREAAARVLPPLRDRSERPVFRARRIIEGVGSAERGRAIYHQADGANCVKCHSLAPDEEKVGPSLGAIAAKYGKEGMLQQILYPSAGIADQYVSWIVDTTSQGLLTGILVEDTPDRVVIRTESAQEFTLTPAEILERRRASLSIMPEDLVQSLTEQDMIDLLEFLATLTGEEPNAG